MSADWIHWTKSHFKTIKADSISALLFITRNKEIEIIYKPTPIINDANGGFEGIMGNMFEDGSTSAIIKIDSDNMDHAQRSKSSLTSLRRFVRNFLSLRVLSKKQNGKKLKKNFPSSSSQPWLPSRMARKSNRLNLTMTS